jgi:hypothetical protein
VVIVIFFFFFRQRPAYEIMSGDWSDVCSSDLAYHSMRRGDPWGAVRNMTGSGKAPNRGLQTRWEAYSDKVRGGTASINEAAAIWLSMQYGWLPLLQDAKAGAEALAHHLNTPFRKTYRVTVRKEVDSIRTTYWRYIVDNARYAVATATRTHRRGLIAKIVERPTIAKLLGLTDPANVAWELLPYSFVADWFIPIGDFLRARGLESGLTGIFITADKKMGNAHTPTSPWFDHTCRSSYYDVIFTRSISTTLKVPMPTFKPLNKVASWQHCANAVALVVASGHAGFKASRGY